MDQAQSGRPTPPRPIRLWPGVAAVTLQWLFMLAFPAVVPGTGVMGLLIGLAFGPVVAIWWIFFSRAAWIERLGALVLIPAAVYEVSRVVHPSIATAMMGMLLAIYAIPVVGLALVVWAVATRRLPVGLRRPSLVAAILVASAAFTLVRTDGVMGEGRPQLRWRWTQTAEQRLLARSASEPTARPPAPTAAPPAETSAAPPSSPGQVPLPPASATGPGPAGPAAPSPRAEAQPVTAVPAAAAKPAAWPGFRGPGRDSVVRGVQIDADWSRVPPTPLWRRAVGPGWSSFAVDGDLIYTQEQRGDEEVVACYRLSTGEPVWRHRDSVRFYESNGGAGPRATPTLDNGRVYTLGATGILNALDARDGRVLWSRNAAADSGEKVPTWGFAASPLVIDDLVVAAAAGRLMAYDLTSGAPRWSGPARGGSYSSPQFVTLDGVPQVLLVSDVGTIGLAPADGALLWEQAWAGASIVQPALVGGGDLLVSTSGPSGGLGVRRLSLTRGAGGWTANTRWTSTGLKPYFNDFVVHKGHAYGFDGGILSCIDLQDGRRVWKGGRYGYGQLVLLQDQDLLLLVSEEGELALVSATPDQFREVARVGALSAKTWNHPVLVGDTLLVRNGEEMAAFRLALGKR